MQTANIGKNIEEIRNFRNISKEGLAKKCRVDVEVISKWENGDIIPNIEDLWLLAKELKISVDYFFVDWDKIKGRESFSSDADAMLTVALSAMSAAKSSGPLQKMLLQRLYIEELVNLKLMIVDIPQYSVACTTKRERRAIISCFEDIVGDEYEDILNGYVNGKNEIGKLKDEILARSEEHRIREQEEIERKRNHPIWEVYINVVDYLESAVENEFVDLRYAKRAVEELETYLEDKGETMNDDVLESVYRKTKEACENQDDKMVGQILTFLQLYGDVLWSQLD